LNIFPDTDVSAEQQQLLWEKFRAGDAAAFATLTETLYRPIYNYAIKLSREEDFVADCIQELYLDLWERRSFLGKIEFVKPYMLKAIRNRIIKESIKIRRFREAEELDFVTDKDESVEWEIVASEFEREKITHLKQLLGKLTKRQQEIIYLRFYQNLEFDEIAEVMGLRRQSVANLMHRTIGDIRSKWILLSIFCILKVIISFGIN
jgi:RNA polymerase sigma factor (sigma-70 family)